MSTNPSQIASSNGGSEILVAAAQPDLFRKNSFRITGLPVEATAGDIARQVEKARLSEKYGGGSHRPIPLPLNPPPDAGQLREAIDRLRDPERRLIDEFFWFWPHKLGGSRDDAALTALSRGANDEAESIWKRQENAQSVSNVSMHNLAVLMHARALDLHYQNGAGPAMVPEQLKLWTAAYRRWKQLLDDEGFWSRLTARIRDLDDPRLTTGTSRRMRTSLPLALLMINAQLAVKAAEAGKTDLAKQHLGIMKASGFPDDVVQEALRRAVDPIRQRIKLLCQAADKETDVHLERGDTVMTRLLAETKALLAVLDLVLPASSPARDSSHDEVALVALRCQIGFGNKTKNWKKSVELLEQALPIAVSKSARERIEDNLRIVRENNEYGTCFFCGQRPREEKSDVQQEMYGNVRRTPTWRGTEITWNHRKVAVPRCAPCAKFHARVSRWTGLAVALCILLGFVSCGIAVNSQPDGGGLGFLLLLGIGIGGSLISRSLIWHQLGGNIKPYKDFKKYKAIQETLKSGWHFGSKPQS